MDKRDLLSSVGLRFAIRRLISLMLVVATLAVLTFLLVHMIPGDPARRIGGIEATEEQVAAIRADLGLNDPLWAQFRDYLYGLLRLDLGTSFVNGADVSTILLSRLGATVQLAGLAIVVTLIASVGGGLLMAAVTRDGRRPRLEALFTAVTGGAASMPSFLAATFLAFLLAVQLGWFPVAGNERGAVSLVLPVLAISIAPTSILIRIVRVEALNILAQDYIRVARSKHVPNFVLHLRHVVPNVLSSALTIGGLTFGALLGGTVVVENIFAWPGLGPKLVEAVSKHDYPVIQGAVLLLGTSVVVVNALVDAALAYIDRRSMVSAT